ncbi:MAG: glycosyltransferase, partial [Spirochaetales bacterium]|nr:glycosyltransferase [Spirochaetales bacterium]
DHCAYVPLLYKYGYEGPVEVMPNGTDLVVDEKDLPSLREQGARTFEIPEGIPLLLYIGQHIKEKNLDLIIDSLALLSRKNIPFLMLFIGDGYHAPALKRKVAESGLSGRVIFKGIIRDRMIITQAYARADLLFFPSLYDTSSLIIREAAGMRVPSLLVRGSSTAAGVIDKVNGFLAENNSGSMAASLEQILTNPALRKEAGKGAYQTLYRTWEQVAMQVADRYRTLIEEYASRMH